MRTGGTVDNCAYVMISWCHGSYATRVFDGAIPARSVLYEADLGVTLLDQPWSSASHYQDGTGPSRLGSRPTIHGST